MGKKQTITKSEILIFNEVWISAKVKGLSNEATKDYLYLKIKVADFAKKISEEITNAKKTIISELGYKEGENIPQERFVEVNRKINDPINILLNEEIEINTHVLSSEDLFNCILNIDENKDLTTESKSLLLKYLVKE